MKCIFWNVRGFTNPSSRLVFKQFCLTNNPDFVFISEPWILVDNVPAKFWKSLNLKIFAVNDR